MNDFAPTPLLRAAPLLAAHSPPEDFVARSAALAATMQDRAAALDEAGAFPTDDIAALSTAGILAMPLPIERGASWIDGLAAVLIRIGEGNLSVGRIVEAHVNARHLIGRYGTPAQRLAIERDVANRHLFALWVTDPPTGGLTMVQTGSGIRLTGGKMFCSGAGFATRALVTARNSDGAAQMLILSLGHGEKVQPLPSPLQGMRAAVTGAVDFTGVEAPASACLGQPGDYLREPDLSAGAWRGSAVALGGLGRLVDLAAAQLEAAGRLEGQHHLHRLGQAMIARETARLWLHRAARTAEDAAEDPAHAVAYVGLARIAIELACLDAMRVIQRSLGLSAFRTSNPVEQLCRDLGTYLRQPAPDEVLTEAAAHFSRQPGPKR